jgi:hypothetical protein
MKNKDIAIIISVVFVSIILSFIVASKVITTPANRQQKVPIASNITDNFIPPNPTYFNFQAIDPTKLIQIQNNTNTAPFNNH